ncbi:MAG: TMEM165/GDT1 family protein [Thermodesulfovibrionales bacterium]
MLQDIFIPFLTIALAELGDKTQLAVLCLSSKTKKYVQLLLGITIAFVITDGLAILLGNFITNYVSIKYLKIVSGGIFIFFGIFILLSNKEEEAQCELRQPFSSAFFLIFVSEIGDKTQIASGLFATQYNPFMVFLGVISALTVLSVMAIYLGRFIVTKINKRLISTIAGIVFVLLGISFFSDLLVL